MRAGHVARIKTRSYDRPNQKWVCGRSNLGEPCPLGPDDQGRCRASFECRPGKRGDRWVCTRPEEYGGPCGQGPLPDGQCSRPIPPCVPVLSLRARRGLVVRLTVASCIAGVLLILSTESGRRFVTPGGLTLAHSSPKSDCADCHRAGEGRLPISWLHSAFAASGSGPDNDRCLHCHDLGSEPHQPHGLAPAEMAILTEKARATGADGISTPASRMRPVAAGPGAMETESLACAVCHREHRGRNHRLAELTDRQCQTCHHARFSSFAAGHPPFAGYPFSRRTRINFDHASHLNGHFNEDRFKTVAPESCMACHTLDFQGRSMVIGAFERVCADCHADQIRGKGRADAPGIPIIRLPGLDLAALKQKGVAVGEWPEDAEGELSPGLAWFLARDPQTQAALSRLQGVDLLDLREANPPQLQAVQQVAWALKEFLFDLTTKGQAEWIRRIQAGFQVQVPSELGPLAGQLPFDSLAAGIGRWFPHLKQEISQRRAPGAPADAPTVPVPVASESAAPVPEVKPEAWTVEGGWYRSDTEYSLYYRPTGHADRFLTAWLSLLIDPAKAVQPDFAQTLFRTLASPRAPGLCTKCHSIDQPSGTRINWRGASPNPLEHRFTKFSHATHLSLLDEKGCLTCHPFNERAPREAYSSAFGIDKRDPSAFTSNFKAVDKSVCASCHAKPLAGDHCLLCHNYHVGHFVPHLPKAFRGQGARGVPPLPSASDQR